MNTHTTDLPNTDGGVRLETFGGLRLVGSAFTRPKPLLLLAFLTLNGPQNRRHLAELFWPGASDHMNSLTVALAQLRRGVPGVIEGLGQKVGVRLESDAGAFLARLGRGDHEAALALYKGDFLAGFVLSDWGEELEEWVAGTRERLAERAVRARAEQRDAARAQVERDTLPTSAKPFVGREAALSDLSGLLQDEPGCRLLTLTGPGGVGKTRLAVEAARRVHFPDGRFFVPLEPLADVNSVTLTIAEVSGLQLRGGERALKQLLAHFRDKAALLVLDNFEHLMGARDLVRDLLAASDSLSVLVTSRQPLNVQGEWRYPVEGLSFPNDASRARQGERYEALALLETFTRRVKARFSAEPRRETLLRLCQLVGGMPLALELAASWLHVLPLEEIVSELERNLEVLRTRHSDLPERHHDMAAVLEGSWKLLSPELRASAARLAVFRGGFRRRAAERVAGASLADLATLVEGAFFTLSEAGRFEQHPLLHRYARDALAASGGAGEVREAHLHYYSEQLPEWVASLKTEVRREALPHIEAELPNVRAAWQYQLEARDAPKVAAFAVHLFNLYDLLERYFEGLNLIRAAAQRLRSADPSLQALVRSREGLMLARLGRFEEARGTLEATLTHLDGSERAFAQSELVSLYFFTGAPERGLEAAEKALSHASTEPPERRAALLYQVAPVYWQRGDGGRARAMYEEGYALARASNNANLAARCLVALGYIAYSAGDLPAAEGTLRGALRLSESIQAGHSCGVARGNLGAVLLARGRRDEARPLLREAVAELEAIGDAANLADFSISLGRLELSVGRREKALGHLAKGLKVALEAQAQGEMLAAVSSFADLFGRLGEDAEAAALYSYVAAHPATLPSERRAANVTASTRDVTGLANLTDVANDLLTRAPTLLNSVARRKEQRATRRLPVHV